MTVKASLKDIIAYILKKFPECNDLSDSRLTKMIYLADWKKAVQQQDTVSDIKWYYDNYGPYVESIIETANNNPEIFNVKHTLNAYGTKKKVISLKNKNYPVNISNEDASVLEDIITRTKDKSFTDFKKIVYNTYPIVFSNQYEYLDLIKLADEFRVLVKKVKKVEARPLAV